MKLNYNEIALRAKAILSTGANTLESTAKKLNAEFHGVAYVKGHSLRMVGDWLPSSQIPAGGYSTRTIF